MNVHKNAGLTPRGREILISRLARGEHPNDVGTAMGVSANTVYKWRRRYCSEGLAGLQDRSSRPHTSPGKTPDDIEARVVALRKDRRIYHRIAAEAGVSKSTVERIHRIYQSHEMALINPDPVWIIIDRSLDTKDTKTRRAYQSSGKSLIPESSRGPSIMPS